MTVTKYANGRIAKNSSYADALSDLRDQYPDMVTHRDGQRTLVWADELTSENDDGAHAVAELIVNPNTP